MLEIRLLREDETELLHRFLERSFGHGWGWFYRRRPALARPEVMTSYSLVGLYRGDIVSHVGMYPIPLRSGSVEVMCGGIGSVATAPEARGKGYMSQMLPAAVKYMTEWGWPVSVLWGDRQRYERFGWERAGSLLHVTLNRRSVAPCPKVSLQDVDPTDPANIRQVAALHEGIPYRVDRPYLSAMLQGGDMRLFVGDDGYLISFGARSGDLEVVEVSSPTGQEAALIAAAMERADAKEAHVIMEPVFTGRTERLLSVAAHWYLESRAMFRLLDWPAFLKAAAPAMAQRAVALAPFSVSVTCRYDTDDTPETTATVRWDGDELAVAEGGGGEISFTMEARQLVQLTLGTPMLQYDGSNPLHHLLPVPLHIPRFDWV